MSWEKDRIAKAKEIIEMYPQKRSALGPLLYLALDKDGYISNESIVEISSLIGITEVQVQSVASFYSMYKQEPTGKYLLSVCKSISCEISNSSDVITKVKEFTNLSNNETDEEGLFTYESVECIGACGGAPAIQINYETVEGLTPEKAVDLCKWLKEEQPKVIVADELQLKFGGQKSFDWAIEDNSGSSSPVPGFQTYEMQEDIQ
ncbi:MAG: NAD(P)H-dependent oxidoreductase subunit E [Candidatus Actinomarina sp.]|jgi:NADH-quinone oxidoreductase subunit E|nr:NAD(P)H-dependent oxidoreductase subunit E [Candidatus Actinomarina sp.]NND24291.1 NAD(P)H-dependent oxidoreductase subunit E [Acidimicrobiia bacterium]|tara:strand:- start:11439 stop:12053 length:615 start_codon:yes stop_codon:yes gene_type:complete